MEPSSVFTSFSLFSTQTSPSCTILQRLMAEPEWGESWDDWDGDAEYSFGPDGRFMDMSTMDVGRWTGSEAYNEFPDDVPDDWPDGVDYPPPPTPPPQLEIINEPHFIKRIVRHTRYVQLLDAVKHYLNQFYENTPEDNPKGRTKDYFLTGIKTWMWYCEEADTMKGDMRILSQCRDKVTYLDAVMGTCETLKFEAFACWMTGTDDNIVTAITECIEYWIGFFEGLSTNITEDRLRFVLEAVPEGSTICVDFPGRIDRHFPRGGGFDTELSLDDRIKKYEDVRRHLDEIGVDISYKRLHSEKKVGELNKLPFILKRETMDEKEALREAYLELVQMTGRSAYSKT